MINNLLIPSLSMLLLLSIQCLAATDCYKVLKVIDGDTFYIDFNSNGKIESNERVRLNGIDAFEIKRSATLLRQAKNNSLSEEETIKLGYLGKQFAQKTLLNKKVRIQYSAQEKTDKYNRNLVSVYYDCNRNNYCKSYEQEILKEGLATVYKKSNIKKELLNYQNNEKIKENALNTHKFDIVVLNKRSGAYHKYDCEYAWKIQQLELIKKPIINFRKHPASCCHDVKTHHKIKQQKYKPFNKIVPFDAEEENIQIYFLSPLKQKKPVNKCTSDACKTLLYNIDHAQTSIDFAIFGIREQDEILNAIAQAHQRGVKVRWVTDLTEKKQCVYYDTPKLMKLVPNYMTDYDSADSLNIPDYKYKLKYQGALMHNKFFIFDNKTVFTGSTNISNTCLTGFNSNVAVLINSPVVADVYKQEFEQMYGGRFHTEKRKVNNNEKIKLGNIELSIYFSPANKPGTEQVIPLIAKATKYIYVPAFYLTRNDIIDELIKAHNRGVDVKIIVDETSVAGKYVNIDYIKNNGVNIKVEHWKGKMHMKSMIIDDNTLIIGSMNFTKQGEVMNDENCLIIKNANILTPAYKAHFLELWNSIK